MKAMVLPVSSPLSRPASNPAAIHNVGADKGSSNSGVFPTSQRVYRLVDQHGLPHPVLDDLYDSLESAWAEALAWWSHWGIPDAPVGIGVEVSTASGSWRTLRHPDS